MNASLMIGDRIATADLSDMENLHGFLIMLPIVALAIGTLALIFAVHTRARRLRIVALALVPDQLCASLADLLLLRCA